MPQLILVSFLLFAAWLIRRDTTNRQGISAALWIPTLWVGIIASRPVSAWLGTGGGIDTLDGSPLDRAFYMLMIVAALLVLSRRTVNWGWLIGQNWPLLVFYTFLLISVVWANSPVSSFKRWFKEFGNILIVLVILTEVDPIQAIRAVFVRCAYVLIPLSLIFIRYFPDLGRLYGRSGYAEAIGVTFQKNSLGTMVLACGLIFLWDWIDRTKSSEGRQRRFGHLIPVSIAAISVWLLNLCDSKTSIVALVAGSAIVCTIKLPRFRSRISAFGMYTLVGVVVFFLLDREIGLSESIVQALGRDMTFTGRTDVWRELLNVGTDPIFGSGFMSFWDDPVFQSKLPIWVAHSAHNGYIEMYLAGGVVGLVALSIMLIGNALHINRALQDGSAYSAVRFAIFVMMLIACFTESNFACMTPLGFLFLLAVIGYGRPSAQVSFTTQGVLGASSAIDVEQKKAGVPSQ